MNQSIALPRPLKIFLVIALFLDVVALASESVARFALHLTFPYDSPVLDERWAVDLKNYILLFPHLHTPEFFQKFQGQRYEYPAPVAPLYGLIFKFPHPARTLEIILISILIAAAIGFAMHLRRKGLATTRAALVACGALLLSYPALFELKQGNMELFVCVVVGIGIWCFGRGRFEAAAVCIGIAGAMKIFPFVYMGLFVARRQYRALGVALIAAMVITVASLLYIDPSLTVAWHGVQNGLATYQREVSPTVVKQTSYDHSLFSLAKLIHADLTNRTVVSSATVIRYEIIVAVGGIALFFFRIRSMPVINQVICLCVASIILPPVSYDYTLLNLYIPWAMVVCLALDNRNFRTEGLSAAFVCFAIATSIQTEVIYNANSVGGQIKAITLCALMVIALRYPFGEVQSRELGTDGTFTRQSS